MTDIEKDSRAAGFEDRFERLERQLTTHGHLLQTGQPGLPNSGIHRRLALPIPLASYGVGSTVWFLGLMLVHAGGTQQNAGWTIIGVPMGFFMVFLCGIGEFFCGNTFGAALFLNVGSAVGGLAIPFLPFFSVPGNFVAALGKEAAEAPIYVDKMVGLYNLVLIGVLTILLIGAQRTAYTTMSGLVIIIMVSVTFGSGLLLLNTNLLVGAGGLLIALALNLFYSGTALLLMELRHPLAKFMPIGAIAPH